MQKRRRTNRLKVGAALAIAPLVLAGCLASSNKTSGNKGANKNSGKTITFTVAFSGPQFQQFKDALTPYAKSQGITVKFASDTNFNADIVNKVKANQLPDIAMFPQPGILAQIAKQGKVADLDKVLDINSLKSQMATGILGPGTVNGKVYGIPPSINIKTLVFYPKKAWARLGLKAPTTLDGLMQLTKQIKAQGKTPWCMGIQADQATGWPATDWIEQLVLAYGGVSTYNDWVTNKVKFDSPVVRQAADYFHTIFSTPGYVFGGQKAIAGTAFGTAGNPMFNVKNTESNPGCYMFKQGNFITQPGFFPTAIEKDLDANVGAFLFPGKTADSHPVEGGGDLAALFSGGNQSAIKIMKYILSPQFCDATCGHKGGFISPFKNYPAANYPDNLSRQMANIAYSSTSFSFDGSDSMPGEVGSGTFWKEMTSWINGQTDEASALKAIDASWPSS